MHHRLNLMNTDYLVTQHQRQPDRTKKYPDQKISGPKNIRTKKYPDQKSGSRTGPIRTDGPSIFAQHSKNGMTI